MQFDVHFNVLYGLYGQKNHSPYKALKANKNTCDFFLQCLVCLVWFQKKIITHTSSLKGSTWFSLKYRMVENLGTIPIILVIE